MATQVTVAGTFNDAEGNALTGTVTFTPTQPLYDVDGNQVVGTAPIVATLSGGTFSAVLYATDDATTSPANATYTVSEDLAGADGAAIKRRFRAEIPNTAPSIRYEDITAAIPASQATQSYATAAQVAALNLVAGPSRLTSTASCYGHSYGKLGASDAAHLFTRLLADQLHAPLRDFHASGTRLVDRGNANTTQAGHIRILGDAAVSTAYNKQTYLGRRGVATITHGINDIQTYGSDADWDQLVACYVHCLRSSISWLQLATFHAHDQSSSGQAFGGSGSWTSGAWVAGFEEGPGTSRRQNTSSGATCTVTTGANAAGRTVALFLPTNFTGGSRAASQVSFTLDGTAVTPIGWTSTDLSAVGLAAMGHAVCAVARFIIPDDASAHTIVATAGTGGMTISGWGVESTAPRPVLVANTARRSDGGYTPNGSDAKVAALNVAVAAVVAEFGSPVLGVDIDTALAANTRNFSDGLHPNDQGHELIARTYRAALDNLGGLTNQAKGML